MSLGHVYIVLEPVGSARLMFGDDRYYEFMCFDVLKVVRSPGCDHGHDKESLTCFCRACCDVIWSRRDDI